MSDIPDHAELTAAMRDAEALRHDWMSRFASSILRMPRPMEREAMASTVEPILEAIAEALAPDRAGRVPVGLHFRAGASALREVEKAVSFAAAKLGAGGYTGFDVGALMFTLRDVLCTYLHGPEEVEMQRYMEWLAALAADSLATGREQALVERWRNQLDEGTPLVMITPELPALLFVCDPDRTVVAGMFGRLLLTVVRTGAKALIIDVRGVSRGLNEDFAEPLRRFLEHKRVATKTQIFACGVRNDDADSWMAMADAAGASLVLENHFDLCVSHALKVGGRRLIQSQ